MQFWSTLVALFDTVITILLFLVGVIVATTRNRLDTLEKEDKNATKSIMELEREVYRDMDILKNTMGRDVTELAVKLSGEYVQRRELEIFRQEIIQTINEGRKETLSAILRIEQKIDNQN